MKNRMVKIAAALTLTVATCLVVAGVAFGATNVPAWWIDRGETRFTMEEAPVGLPPATAIEYFTIDMWTSDHNSGLRPPGIEFRVPAWMPPVFADWAASPSVTLWMNRATHANDGIFALEYRATDKAGNTMTASVPVKIDTRPPVTDGIAGWVNGLEPYVMTAVDQAPGSGVAATAYRVDQATPWQVNVAASVAPTLETTVFITPPGGTPVQGSVHTIDFGSVDAALPFDYDPLYWLGPSWHWGNLEGTSWIWAGTKDSAYIEVFTGYQTRSVKLDVTAPVVTAMDPTNGNWQTGPAVINFSGTDVGSGYAFTEWSTDGGSTWTRGERAEVGGDGVITVSYRGVDNVGLMSQTQTITVQVASTPPTVTAQNVSVKKGNRATFPFAVTAVTPTAGITIQLRSSSGRTLSTHRFAGVPTNAEVTRSFRVDLKKGKYDIRVGAVDEAGNEQTRRGSATLTVR